MPFHTRADDGLEREQDWYIGLPDSSTGSARPPVCRFVCLFARWIYGHQIWRTWWTRHILVWVMLGLKVMNYQDHRTSKLAGRGLSTPKYTCIRVGPMHCLCRSLSRPIPRNSLLFAFLLSCCRFALLFLLTVANRGSDYCLTMHNDWMNNGTHTASSLVHVFLHSLL